MDPFTHCRVTRKDRMAAARTLFCSPHPPEVQAVDEARDVFARMKPLEVIDTVSELVRAGALLRVY